jgi:hypothetical protein
MTTQTIMNPLKHDDDDVDDYNNNNKYKKLRGISPQANYTDRATAACRRS